MKNDTEKQNKPVSNDKALSTALAIVPDTLAVWEHSPKGLTAKPSSSGLSQAYTIPSQNDLIARGMSEQKAIDHRAELQRKLDVSALADMTMLIATGGHVARVGLGTTKKRNQVSMTTRVVRKLDGATEAQAQAEWLNSRGIKSPTGKTWTAKQVADSNRNIVIDAELATVSQKMRGEKPAKVPRNGRRKPVVNTEAPKLPEKTAETTTNNNP